MELENRVGINWDKVGFYLSFMGGLLTVIATIITAAWIIKSDIHTVEVRLGDQISAVDSRLKSDIHALEIRLGDKINAVDSRLTKIETVLTLKDICSAETLSSN